MTFPTYLLLIALTILHPIEAFFPDLAQYRIVLVLSLVVLGMAVFESAQTRQIATRPLHLLLLGGLMATIAISMVLSGWAGGMVPALIEFSAPALLFLLTALVVTNMRRLKITCGVLVLCLVALSVAGICAFHYGFMVEELVVREHTNLENHLVYATDGLIPAQDLSGESLWRIHSWGFLSDPNDFSQAIVMCLPMLMGAWLRRYPLRNLLRIWLPCTILVYAIYLTHSRGAVLGLGIVLLFGMMRKVGPIFSGMLVMSFGLAAAVVGATGGRGYSSGEESAGGRIAAWSEGLQMLRGNPFFGVGYGSFTEHFHVTAHNSFVLCFAELGIVGFFFWVALIVCAFKEMRLAETISPRDSDEYRWAVLLRLSLLGFLTCALFLSRTYQPTLYILLALCLAVGHCAQLKAAPEVLAAMPRTRWVGTTIKIMVLSIILIYIVVRFQNAFVN